MRCSKKQLPVRSPGSRNWLVFCRQALLLPAFAACLGLIQGKVIAQPVTQVAAGVGHILFTKADGSLWVMGENFDGQLGIGSQINYADVPQQLVSSGVGQIAAGSAHSLYQKGNTLWVTGNNTAGELGDGTSTSRSTPEQVLSVPMSESLGPIAAGGAFSLFGTYNSNLTASGGLWAMGDNELGQLGDGTETNTNLPEEVFPNAVGIRVTSASGGLYHTLFTLSDGSLWAMGDDSLGELGNGTNNATIPKPQLIVSSNVTAISAGYGFSYFCKSDGSLWAMGDNSAGQLGDGTTNDSHAPKLIVRSNVVSVAASFLTQPPFGLFLKKDGSLWGIGDNGSGQLGLGTTNAHYLPVQIVPSNVVAVAAGGGFSVFIKTDGSLWGMGAIYYGQTNANAYTNNYSPIEIAPPPPTLTSVSLSGANLVVLWPTNASGFYLQSASNLVPPVAWSFVSRGQGVVGSQNAVTNPLSRSQQFYRLSNQ